MHKLSPNDQRSEELETLPKSRNTTTVFTANGEVETNEEAQEDVHDLEPFVTVQILEDTLAVLSLGKFCEDRPKMWLNLWQYGKLRSYCCPWIVIKHERMFVLLHRYRRTHRAPLQVQQDYEVDDTYYQASGDRGDHQKIKKTKIKMRTTVKQREDRTARPPEVVRGVHR